MDNCIICHLGINKVDSFQECPNGHPVHGDCLQEWLVHSSNCPLCNESYSQGVIEKFKAYINKKELEKQKAFEEETKKDTVEKIEKVTDQIAFMKFTESIDILIEQKAYDYALSRLEMRNEQNLSTEKGRKITFLKGKLNYLKGRYDLAINF
ncbi:MAG: RING finger protein, partial [Promethearchaeota archaeon]